MNSADAHSENSYSDSVQDDTLAWDQIQPVFAYTDQQETEQPLLNEPATNVAPPVGDDFVHSDRLSIEKTPPVTKESRNELVPSSVVSGADFVSHHRLLRPNLMPMPPFAVPLWPLVERIGILGLMIVAVASVSVLLVRYGQSLDDNVLPPSPSVASRGGPLPSVQAATIGSAMVDDRVAAATELTRPVSPGEIPTESQLPQRRVSIAPEDLKAQDMLRSSAMEPMPSMPPAPDTIPATTGRPIAVSPSAGSATVDDRVAAATELTRPVLPGEIPTQSQHPQRRVSIAPGDLKAQDMLQSSAREPRPSMPPAPDTMPATTGRPIAVSPSAAAAPTKPAVGLANDEMGRLIKHGQDFLNQGDFAAARLLFLRAANAGSAEAALALGSTYDPAVVKKLGAVAVTPDVDRALKWYATAADRGSFEAAERYADLMHAH